MRYYNTMQTSGDAEAHGVLIPRPLTTGRPWQRICSVPHTQDFEQ
jgi:hypothetical protein